MSIKAEKYDILDGVEVTNFILDNECGLSAEILSLGGIVKNLCFDGVDMVLGHKELETYSENPGYFGALIGRNSNRIENAEFLLNGKNYTLAANEGSCNLHGGVKGFDKKIWTAEAHAGDEPSLVLTCFSPDGEEGFPSDVHIKVTYTLTRENSLKIHYEGKSSGDTILNMTNHSYFNLNGHNSGSIDGHTLWLNSEYFTPNTEKCMPNGEVLSVEGTPFDFRHERSFADAFAVEHEQTTLFGGFDHNFVLAGRGYRHSARLRGDKTGIVMDMYTDLSGVQIYTANTLKPREFHKGGSYGIHQSVCLETQYFPNAMKYSHFLPPILKAGDKYDTTTEYKFSKA